MAVGNCAFIFCLSWWSLDRAVAISKVADGHQAWAGARVASAEGAWGSKCPRQWWAIAEGARITPKALGGVGSGKGCLLPSRLEGLGKRHKLPSGIRLKTHFWHIFGSLNTSERQKMRFLPSATRKLDIFVWKRSLFFYDHDSTFQSLLRKGGWG